jgi:menaquinone-dependent protoporphyrinogen oxidase
VQECSDALRSRESARKRGTVFSGRLFIPIITLISNQSDNPLKGMIMSARILVAYASPHGSTAEIAEAVGKQLQSAGYSVDVRELNSVSSPEDYKAVIIGGPFYMGKIVGDVGKFIGRNRDALAKVPVAAFAVGVAPVGKDPAAIGNAMKKLHEAFVPLVPVAETIFAGKIDLEKLSFFQKFIVGRVHAPVGDFRDWAAITAWAIELPAKLGV